MPGTAPVTHFYGDKRGGGKSFQKEEVTLPAVASLAAAASAEEAAEEGSRNMVPTLIILSALGS